MDHPDDGGGDDDGSDDGEYEYGDANGDDDFQRLFFIVFRAEMGI